MGYCYRVELMRLVSSPSYGPNAYHRETKRHDFPFGKNQQFKTGKEALAEAESFAVSMLDISSSVSIWRLSGGKYGYNGGTGTYLKDDRNSRFDEGWGE